MPYNVNLELLTQELSLEAVYLPRPASELRVDRSDVNRPGLALTGFFDLFDADRIQILGKSELEYVGKQSEEVQRQRLAALAERRPPAIVITRGLEVHEALLEACKQCEVPLLRSADITSDFMAALIAFLNVQLAPRIVRHGVFVEIYGEGVLLTGDSGVGKSETAVELVKRGHRLVADDAVEIRRVSNRTLVGSAPENIRHFVELRGIGIINVRRIFGMGAVKLTEKIDMIVHLEPWDADKTYDRMGLENQFTELLGIKVPTLTIPIKPGRNLAIILEVASMNNRQKKMGYNGAQELLKNLGMGEKEQMDAQQAVWAKY